MFPQGISLFRTVLTYDPTNVLRNRNIRCSITYS